MQKIRMCALLLLISCFALAFSACGNSPVPLSEQDKRVVMTVGGYDVTYDMYKWFYLKYKEDYTDEDFASANAKATEKAIRDRCIESIKGSYASLSLAADYSIFPSDSEIKTALEEKITELIEENYGSRDKYLKALAEYNMTDNLLRIFLTADLCEDMLYTTLKDGLGILPSDEDEIYDAIMGEDFARMVLVYIQNDKEDSIENNRQLAQTVYNKATGGESFDTLIGNYSENFDMTKDGYYVVKGEYVDELDRVIFGLAEGEISGVVETDTGFYVIKRLKKEPEYVMANFKELSSSYLSRIFYDMIDERAKTLSVQTSSIFESLNIGNIK